MDPTAATSIVDDDRLLNLAQVALFLGVSTGEVYKLTYAGAIPVVKVGARVRIAESALRNYLRAHTISREQA